MVWELDGEFAPYVGGDWELTLTCRDTDGVGTTVGEIDRVSVPLDSVSAKTTPRQYSHTFLEPPGRFEPGVYQLTVNLSYVNAGFHGAISGFAETGPIEFYPTD
ncbi:hypothetical protein GCM10009557_87430 [Virgisporangium ochraceum]|uniref:Uncharacterized protein n=1 Tax=Virgisporangium ochraceum TaxID=65505 RepID=A0A8J3ZWL2_9ACTN|nr:hypothetical protein [Virgisporangium ochraceum]GIJ71704.1 hypothetical protein Voc01_066210 [Virgisporangium ochraceum]